MNLAIAVLLVAAPPEPELGAQIAAAIQARDATKLDQILSGPVVLKPAGHQLGLLEPTPLKTVKVFDILRECEITEVVERKNFAVVQFACAAVADAGDSRHPQRECFDVGYWLRAKQSDGETKAELFRTDVWSHQRCQFPLPPAPPPPPVARPN